MPFRCYEWPMAGSDSLLRTALNLCEMVISTVTEPDPLLQRVLRRFGRHMNRERNYDAPENGWQFERREKA